MAKADISRLKLLDSHKGLGFIVLEGNEDWNHLVC